MRPRISLLLLAAALFAPAASFAQETAGRVLAASGEMTIARGAEKIAARAGTEVRAGDTIELGAQSSAQVRFTDESIVALRSGTTFRISEYTFQGRAPEEQSAFFNLLKGGMRTVTGLIGRARPDRYGVTTPTATIGIRGTHYTLVHCDNDCGSPGARSDAGGTLIASAAMLAQADTGTPPLQESPRNGTFGSVTDGKIGVANKTGVTEFGADQYFFVASQDQRPERLIGPPEGVNAGFRPPPPKPKPGAQTQQTAAAASLGSAIPPLVAPTGTDGRSGDIRTSSSVSEKLDLPAAIKTNDTVQQKTNDATSVGLASILQPTSTGTVFYRLAGPFSIPVSCAHPPCSNLTSGDITLGVNFTLQRASVSVNVAASDGGIVNVGTPFTSQGLAVTVNGGQVTFGGTATLADNPQNSGAFRCNDCGPGDTPGFFTSISISGTISGSQANVTFSGTHQGGGGTFSATLSSATPPNNDVAAIVTPRSGGGADARSASFWGVQLDGSRRLIDFGPTVGQIKANLGSATNTIHGSRPDAGNLVWGQWTGNGAQVTDFNYVTFSPTGSQAFLPWITGSAINTLPPSLGSVTYSPVGSLINSGFAVLNGASFTADFLNRTMSLNLDTTRTSGELNRFVMSGGSGFSSTTGRFSAGFTGVQCVSGPCTTGGNQAGGSFGGFFAGQNAEGAGVAFTAGFGTGNGVSGVVGFKR